MSCYYRSMAVALLALAGCGAPQEPAEAPASDPPADETVFEPLVETLERAQGVQQTLDAAAAELRRRLEEEER